jgi:hypothetical protein
METTQEIAKLERDLQYWAKVAVNTGKNLCWPPGNYEDNMRAHEEIRILERKLARLKLTI